MGCGQCYKCPSAQPEMLDLHVIGVVEATEGGPRVAYLNEDIPVTSELLAQTQPLPPTQVLRLAAHCEELHCVHFTGGRCSLATRIVQILPPVVDTIPICLIRSTCRWFF